MGNGPGDLEDYHSTFYSNERFCGGFIWEWADHSFPLGLTPDGKNKIRLWRRFRPSATMTATSVWTL